MSDDRSVILTSATKAEVLEYLAALGFNIPLGYFFSIKKWQESSEKVLAEIKKIFKGVDKIAIRSSSQAEDSISTSMAGAFLSLLNVNTESKDDITGAIEKVIESYYERGEAAPEDQILVQTMVQDVAMSGVVMSKVLDDGSPYYVVNFDDSSGKTDSVTSGSAINKTVYIYNGVKEGDFDSPKLLNVIKLVRSLEQIFNLIPLDIEFAVNSSNILYLLQVRRICSVKNWNKNVADRLSAQIKFVHDHVQLLNTPRYKLFGKNTILGVMPDWNPAEMIGIIPRPLASSLYRFLITKNVWCKARKVMGYHDMPNTDLMVLISGHPYIDVRCSFNSFLPSALPADTAEKLVDAWLTRLNDHPHLHDKVEFEIVNTVLDFSFDKTFNERYPGVLTLDETNCYKDALKKLTIAAIIDSAQNTLKTAYDKFAYLEKLQKLLPNAIEKNAFLIVDRLNIMLEECKKYGTLPFSTAARHGFIAEAILRSAVARGAISAERAQDFKTGVRTITKEMSEDFYKVNVNEMGQGEFLSKYGHLRPSSYDILSPCYKNREALFSGNPLKPHLIPPFTPTSGEIKNFNLLFKEIGFHGIDCASFFNYAANAIKGREYGKFIFSRHLSFILESIAALGEIYDFTRQHMSLLTIDQIISISYASLPNNPRDYLFDIIEKARDEYDLALSFKLSYLIRSGRDVYVVPQQRTEPNFISRKNAEAKIKFLSPEINANIDLSDCIVCIEGADPGYDWIFSRRIAGLVTKFGGANSHMAIRCAEYDLPAAIGCGEQTFERIVRAGGCIIKCQEKILLPYGALNV
ncbi:MAG: hypothetical protein LBK69_03695 [Syntrophomonadaceae bacterium]|jgi:hypothetical protein|nr:hypothetical protein [Syntrophomonadaceae bacterium]